MRRRHENRDRGASLVELALILPILALLALGTIDIARAYRLNIRLEGAAREGASFLQISPNDVTCTNGPDIKDRVAREDPDLASHAGYEVTVHEHVGGGVFTEYGNGADDLCRSEESTDPVVVAPSDRVRVDVHADFDVLTPLLSNVIGSPLGLTGSAEVVAQG